MTKTEIVVSGKKFTIRLPDTVKELKALCADDFSVSRIIQIGLHQRQLTTARSLLKAGYTQAQVQEMLDNYTYRAHRVGGQVEAHG